MNLALSFAIALFFAELGLLVRRIWIYGGDWLNGVVVIGIRARRGHPRLNVELVEKVVVFCDACSLPSFQQPAWGVKPFVCLVVAHVHESIASKPCQE